MISGTRHKPVWLLFSALISEMMPKPISRYIGLPKNYPAIIFDSVYAGISRVYTVSGISNYSVGTSVWHVIAKLSIPRRT